MVFFNKLKFLTHQPFQFINKVINAGNNHILKLLNVLKVYIPLSKWHFYLAEMSLAAFWQVPSVHLKSAKLETKLIILNTTGQLLQNFINTECCFTNQITQCSEYFFFMSADKIYKAITLNSHLPISDKNI